MEASARLRLVDRSASDAPTSGSIAVLQFFETPFSSEELGLHFHYTNIILDVTGALSRFLVVNANVPMLVPPQITLDSLSTAHLLLKFGGYCPLSPILDRTLILGIPVL